MIELPSLPYKYSDLEPYIDQETMRVHHTGHHQAYIDKLNTALEKHPDLVGQDIGGLIHHPEKIPEDVRMSLVNNGGGYLNHSFFWSVLAKPTDKDNLPEGTTIGVAIDEQYGGYSEFKEQFKKHALAFFGSGWVWLVRTIEGKLDIVASANQNLPPKELWPLLAIDMWEHAYYLKHQNKKEDYINDFFHVINWDKVNENWKSDNTHLGTK